jgi:hypothetical protein
MSLIEYCLAKDKDIFSSYSKSLNEWIATKTDEMRSQIPEHEWWRKDDINIQEKNIPLGVRYIFLISSVIEKLGKNSFSKESIKKFFNMVESYIENVNNSDEIDEIEILFFESIANYTENNHLDERVYSELPKISKKIWKKNRKFWNVQECRNLSDTIR